MSAMKRNPPMKAFIFRFLRALAATARMMWWTTPASGIVCVKGVIVEQRITGRVKAPAFPQTEARPFLDDLLPICGCLAGR
jgi:hypothetical protein